MLDSAVGSAGEGTAPANGQEGGGHGRLGGVSRYKGHLFSVETSLAGVEGVGRAEDQFQWASEFKL